MAKVGLKFRRRYIFLLVSVLFILSGTLVATGIQNNWGSVNVVEVDFMAEDGSWIESTLSVPIRASWSDPLPGVIIIHGSMANKEWMTSISIELTRRGFVVLAIDANGHGNSDPGTGSGNAALNYFSNLPYVDNSSIGFIGHSMGGGISQTAINSSTVDVKALVLIGSYISANTSDQTNILVATGQFDEVSSYPSDLSPLEVVFGVIPIPDQLYGDFTDGSARKLILPQTDHMLAPIDSTIISETVEWMKNSLKNSVEDAYWVHKNSHIYPIFIFAELIATIGVVISIIPVLAILLDTPFFSDLKKKDRKDNTAPEVKRQLHASIRSFWGMGLLYGAIGVVSFLPLLAIGFFIPFPQSRGSSFGFWLLGSGLIALLVLYMVLRSKRYAGITIKDLSRIDNRSGDLGRKVLKSFILAAMATLWIYGWTLIADEFLVLDFRFYVPIFNDLTPLRAIISPLYLIFVLPYLFIEGMWLIGILKTAPQKNLTRSRISWTLNAILIKCLPYVILATIKFGTGYFFGITVFPGMIGFTIGFLYTVIPLLAISAAITIWSYELTENHYLGTFLNGFLLSWIMASILSIPA